MSLKSSLPAVVFKRIEEINSLIFEIANGNYGYRLKRSKGNDELDGLIGGITMLGEEIKASTVSRDYLQSIYKGVVDLLIILKKDFTIETVNDEVLRKLGYSEASLQNQPFQVILSPSHQKILKKVENDLGKNSICMNIELTFLHADKTPVSHSVSFSVLSDNHEESTRILVIAKDVTAFKETERRLKQQNETLKEIAWIQSHKVRGPVASILGLMKLIDWENKTPSDNMQVIQNLQATAERLDAIIHEIVEKSGHLFLDEDEDKI